MYEEKAKKPISTRKSPLAIDKHLAMLAGTVFVKKCAYCPGSTGKINPDGTHQCSNVGATPAPVTALQAQACKDGIPPNKEKHKKRLRVQNYTNRSQTSLAA